MPVTLNFEGQPPVELYTKPEVDAAVAAALASSMTALTNVKAEFDSHTHPSNPPVAKGA
jgi:hypothetical protein